MMPRVQASVSLCSITLSRTPSQNHICALALSVMGPSLSPGLCVQSVNSAYIIYIHIHIHIYYFFHLCVTYNIPHSILLAYKRVVVKQSIQPRTLYAQKSFATFLPRVGRIVLSDVIFEPRARLWFFFYHTQWTIKAKSHHVLPTDMNMGYNKLMRVP